MKISSYVIHDAAGSSNLERRRDRPPGILRWVLVLSLCAVLIFAVLAFGAVDEWSTFTLEASAAALFLIWAGKQLISKQLKLSKNRVVFANPSFFWTHSRPDCAALGLLTGTSPNTKRFSMSRTAFFC